MCFLQLFCLVSLVEGRDLRTKYPVKIMTFDHLGRDLETVYYKPPERTVCVYQGSVETMLQLGLKKAIVGAAGLDNEVLGSLKKDFSEINYLAEFGPAIETVSMLEPDFIFSWGSYFRTNMIGPPSRWIDAGTNIYMNSNTVPVGGLPRILSNELKDILNLGIIFDEQNRAESIVNDVKGTIDKVVAKTANITDKPRVLVIEPYSGGRFTIYGDKTLGGDMVLALGANLISFDGKFEWEDLIKINPDILFVVYMPYEGDNPEKIKQYKLDFFLKDPVAATLSAVKNKRVYSIMLSEMYASAARTKDGIVTFAKGIYPDLDID